MSCKQNIVLYLALRIRELEDIYLKKNDPVIKELIDVYKEMLALKVGFKEMLANSRVGTYRPIQDYGKGYNDAVEDFKYVRANYHQYINPMMADMEGYQFKLPAVTITEKVIDEYRKLLN